MPVLVLSFINIESDQQLDDIFTNALGPSVFHPIVFKLHMKCLHVKFEGRVINDVQLIQHQAGILM